MGDRTDVEITITMNSYKHPAIKAWVDKEEWPGETFPEAPEDTWEVVIGSRGAMVLFFSECDYGEIPEVEEFLRNNKISYDFAWGAGDEYSSGTRWVRFAKDGSMKVSESYDTDKPDLGFIQEQLEKRAHAAALSYLSLWRKAHEAPCPLGHEPDTWPKEDDQ